MRLGGDLLRGQRMRLYVRFMAQQGKDIKIARGSTDAAAAPDVYNRLWTIGAKLVSAARKASGTTS